MLNREPTAILAIALTLTFFAVFASGAEMPRAGTLVLDPSKTLIEFRLGGSLHNVDGQFKLTHGTITADRIGGKADGVIVVDAASGKSDDVLRDNRMKDSILEVTQWPEITFAPRRITGAVDPSGNFKAQLEGTLSLHGTRHDVMIDTQGHIANRDLIATAHFSIPYVEWGLKDPSLLFLTVDKNVDIDIATAGTISWNQ